MITTITDKKEIDALNEKAWSINRTQPSECKELSSFLITQCDALEYSKGKTYAVASLGASEVWLSNYDEALIHLYKAREELKKLGDIRHEAEVVYHLFCCFYFLADYDNALSYANEILELADLNNDVRAKANAYNGIGTIYYTLGENRKAVGNLSKGVLIAEKISDKHLLARIYDGMGTALYQDGDLKNAVIYKQKSLDAAVESGVKNVEGYALIGLANINFELKNYTEAEKFYQRSFEVRKSVDFKPGMAESLAAIGKLYLITGKPEEAVEVLKQSVDIATEIDSKEILFNAHLSLADYYSLKKDFEEYKKHIDLFVANKELLNSEKQRQKIKSTEMQMRMSQVERENKILEKKHKELENYSRDLELLSSIGKKITSQISIEAINKTVYEILNTIMDATGFGIGKLVNEGKNIEFPGYIEEGVVYESSMYDAADENRMAVVCFNRDTEILISDFDAESGNYVKRSSEPVVGKHVQSLIYLPLKSDNKKVGVITVQSFRKNAYSEYHLNLLRNLAVYCAIAIENATSYERLEEIIEERTKAVTDSYNTTKLLNDLGRDIISSNKLDDIFKKLYASVSQLMDAGCFGVRLYNPDKECVEYCFEIEKGNMDIESISVPMSNDNNYSVWCIKNKESIFINDNIAEHK